MTPEELLWLNRRYLDEKNSEPYDDKLYNIMGRSNKTINDFDEVIRKLTRISGENRDEISQAVQEIITTYSQKSISASFKDYDAFYSSEISPIINSLNTIEQNYRIGNLYSYPKQTLSEEEQKLNRSLRKLKKNWTAEKI